MYICVHLWANREILNVTTAVAETKYRAETTLGTPRAQSWDDEWLGVVDETESRLGRRICGAHAPDGEPCELGSTHRNGRCRFHGGHPRIGGQPGNTNAMVHGLYSRRLRQCDDSCPMWNSCPFAGADVIALGPRKRPVCAFESEAYAALSGLHTLSPRDPSATPLPELGTQAMTPEEPEMTEEEKKTQHDGLVHAIRMHSILPQSQKRIQELQDEMREQEKQQKANNGGGSSADGSDGPAGGVSREQWRRLPACGGSPETGDDLLDGGLLDDSYPSPEENMSAAIDDTAGILYAMLQRATLYVSAHSLVDETEAKGERYSMRSTKMGAGLTAFLRIARELRSWMRVRSETSAQAKDASEKSPELQWHITEQMEMMKEALDGAIETVVRAGVDPRPNLSTYRAPSLEESE